MAGFTVRFQGVREFSADLKKMSVAFDRARVRTVEKLAVVAEADMRRRFKGEERKVRSGSLLRGVASTRAERRNGIVEARAGYGDGPSKRYAMITEFGGTITPKRAQLLTIPVGEALTASGVPRFSSPLQVPGDTMWIFPKGKNPLFVRLDENDEMEVLFVGVKSVTIHGTGAAASATEVALGQAQAIIDVETAAALAAA